MDNFQNNSQNNGDKTLKTIIIILCVAVTVCAVILAVLLIKSAVSDKTEEKNVPVYNEVSVPEKQEQYTPQKEATASSSADYFYRVRKSADDASSQIGAFVEFENAKNLADERKSDGYEVYDSNGKLIYMP